VSRIITLISESVHIYDNLIFETVFVIIHINECEEVMLKRKAYRQLLRWKEESRGSSSLLVEGARRVGKTTLVSEFGKNEYRSFLIIDFTNVSAEIKELFETKRENLDSFFLYLSVYYDIKFFERDTLIVFDEVQAFPLARGFLKHLVADGRYDYIATGSLISIKRNIKDILIPSEEESFTLNPLNFEEFLDARGKQALAQLLGSALVNLEPLPDALHRQAMELFREYMLIGGMPQAIVKYLETSDFTAVDREKRKILDLYRKDIMRYAEGYEGKVISIFDEIPSQLSKQEKRFTLASLEKDARMRSYKDAFFWLSDAMLVNLCHNATDPSVGLRLSREHTTFKCYMADTGLLVTQAFKTKSFTPQQLYRAILFDNLGINEGMLMENVVAQSLCASGHQLYFYSRNNRRDGAGPIEIDFLVIGHQGSGIKINPIEVKSGRRYRTNSLDRFEKKFSERLGNAYILHAGNIEAEGRRIRLPLYLTGWL